MKRNLLCFLSFFCFSLLSLVTIDAQIQFGSERNISEYILETSSSRFHLVDIDNDGDLDKIFLGDVTKWLENLGSGQWGDVAIDSTTIIDNQAQFEDLDGDGNLDIISFQGNNLNWYKNNGGFDFSEAILLFTTDDPPCECLDVGDLDGDGDLDLVLGESLSDIFSSSADLYWLENGGNQSFSKQTVPFTGTYLGASVLSDIDNDGNLDIVFAFASGFASSRVDKVSVLLNDGIGIFSSMFLINANNLSLTENLTFRVEDLNNDSYPDIIFNGFRAVIHLNDGLGNFPTRNVMGVVGEGTFEIVDIDLDGDTDIITIGDYSLDIYLNDGAFNVESYKRLANVASNEPSPYISILDEDGDGDLDIFFDGDGFDAYMENQGGMEFDFLALNSMKLFLMEDVSVSDFDLDGDPDLLVSKSEGVGYRSYILKNDNTGKYYPIDSYFSDDIIPEIIDIDSDGDSDLLWRESEPEISDDSLFWVENQNGDFLERQFLKIIPSSMGVGFPFGVLKGNDLNGDGLIDMIFAYHSIFYMPGLGGGSLGTEQEIQSHEEGASYNRSLNFGDMDEDGDDDLLFTSDPGQISWIPNLGGGSFGQEILIGSTTRDIDYADLSDLDGDGDLDIVFKSLNVEDNVLMNSSIGIYENEGAGVFNNSSTIFTLESDDNIIDVELADIDNDGHNDIIASVDDKKIFHIRNLGTLNFDTPVLFKTTANYTPFENMIAIGDIDNDGDLDLITPSEITRGLLVWYPGLKNSPSISGTAYWDVNNNQTYDSATDITLNNAQVEINPGAQGEFVNEGEYSFFVEEGDYTLSHIPIDNWTLSTDSSTYNVNLNQGDSLTGYDFGFIPTDTIVELGGTMSYGITVCNQIVPFTFTWQNKGTTLLNGSLQITIDDRVDSIDFGINTPNVDLGENQFIWNFDNLTPSEIISKTIHIEIPGIGGNVNPGDSLVYLLEFNYDNQLNPIDSTVTEVLSYNTEILCSYDPNDKLVYPNREGDDNLTLLEEPMTYTIRFQNTGNYFATDVVLKDTLDPALDATTMSILSTSHPQFLQTGIEDGQYITFTFEGIMLPDSTMNLEGSQGYITYSIEPYPGQSVGTVVENTAHIYFDANPAIVTNTTTNTLTDQINTVTVIEACDSLYFGGQLHTESASFTETVCEYGGCITAGTEIIINKIEPQTIYDQIGTGQSYTLPDGLVVTSAGIYQSLFTSQKGCDSLVITDLLLVSLNEIDDEILFEISPNPATDFFSLDFSTKIERDMRVVVLNVLTEKIFESVLNDNMTIDSKEWANGIYFIRILDKEGEIRGIQKLVKQ